MCVCHDCCLLTGPFLRFLEGACAGRYLATVSYHCRATVREGCVCVYVYVCARVCVRVCMCTLVYVRAATESAAHQQMC